MPVSGRRTVVPEFQGGLGGTSIRFYGGTVQGPKSWEGGLKDTVDVQENGGTRVKVQFDNHPGLFVWHCHLLRHEDLGMMRPLELQP